MCYSSIFRLMCQQLKCLFEMQKGMIFFKCGHEDMKFSGLWDSSPADSVNWQRYFDRGCRDLLPRVWSCEGGLSPRKLQWKRLLSRLGHSREYSRNLSPLSTPLGKAGDSFIILAGFVLSNWQRNRRCRCQMTMHWFYAARLFIIWSTTI